ncbi:Putative uncharacterized protein [Weissella confusa LBAE C39-2]|uniref:LOG family protein n=1 Tax=Weissella confusa TaxID=1583 RepID=UPI0002466036|nr:LOG family protein [Weissella confusa]CCF29917.1 Putative uncharacterized protein [Weissella confusa LBAE C39-2]
MKKQTIGVFMGAQYGHLEEFHEAAAAMGKGIAARNWALVYGGSKSGLMGEVAVNAIDAGAEVTGIRPTSFLPEEAGHDLKMEHIDVPDMDTRKRMMFDRADAFVFFAWWYGNVGRTWPSHVMDEVGLLREANRLGKYRWLLG